LGTGRGKGNDGEKQKTGGGTGSSRGGKNQGNRETKPNQGEKAYEQSKGKNREEKKGFYSGKSKSCPLENQGAVHKGKKKRIGERKIYWERENKKKKAKGAHETTGAAANPSQGGETRIRKGVPQKWGVNKRKNIRMKAQGPWELTKRAGEWGKSGKDHRVLKKGAGECGKSDGGPWGGRNERGKSTRELSNGENLERSKWS